jgi:hypothetical protein
VLNLVEHLSVVPRCVAWSPICYVTAA